MTALKLGCSPHAYRHLMAFNSRRYLDALARACAMAASFDVPSYIFLARRHDAGTIGATRWQIIVTDNAEAAQEWGNHVSLCARVMPGEAAALAQRVAVMRHKRARRVGRKTR